MFRTVFVMMSHRNPSVSDPRCCRGAARRTRYHLSWHSPCPGLRRIYDAERRRARCLRSSAAHVL